MLDQVDERTTEQHLKQGLDLAVALWNVSVLETQGQGDHFLAEIRERIRFSGLQAAADLLEKLIDRRQRLFAHDLRLISGQTVRYRNGDLKVRAEARVIPTRKA